jgi:hypothetical protein
VRATGETRSDILAKAGLNVSKVAPPLPSETQSPAFDHPNIDPPFKSGGAPVSVPQQPPLGLSDLDLIDRIAAEPIQDIKGPSFNHKEDSTESSGAAIDAESVAKAQLEELLSRLPINRYEVSCFAAVLAIRPLESQTHRRLK